MDEDYEPWNEFQWEDFLRKRDEVVDRYCALMEKYIDDPNCDQIIAKEMGWEVDDVESDEESDFSFDSDDELAEDNEEWKIAAGIDEETPAGIPSFEKDPLYTIGHDFAVRMIQWYQQLPENIKEYPDAVEILTHSVVPGAKIAGAIDTGDNDKDQIGFRIALYKRALVAANKTLTALGNLKEKQLLDEHTLFPFIKQATELRNAIAIRILEIRETLNG